MKEKKTKKKKLTLKQQKFTAEFIKTGNATEAARRAYKVNDDTARSMGAENLAKPCIQEKIQSAAEKLGIDAEYVLKNYKKLVEYNSSKVIRRQGGEFGSDIEEMRDANVAKAANDSLGKHLNLFKETVELSGKDGESLTTSSEKEKLELAKQIALALKNI